MRLGFWAVAALVFGAFLAHFVLQDRGLVTIAMRGWLVTMSVPALVIMLIVGYFAVRFCIAVWRAPRRLGESIAEGRSRRAGARLTQGLIQLSEGNWARSERLLTRSVRAGEAPLANYLMAARAAQQQGAIERRNDWLKRAFDDLPDAEIAILMTQAQLQFDNGEDEATVATLLRIREKQPENPVAAGLLARTYRRLGDAVRLQALLPALEAAQLAEEARDALAVFALEAAQRDNKFDRARLDALWQSLGSKLRERPVLRAWRARALAQLGEAQLAETELRKLLNRNWLPTLVGAWGELQTPDAARQLKQAETWLRDRPEDPVLLLAAARLCMAAQLWGKARSYLESSLAVAPDPAAYAVYGKLLIQLGEEAAASEAFRQGLALAGNVDTQLPMLDAPEAEQAVSG